MEAIIIGAGKVGFSLAEMLSSEEHDVIVVDVDPERVDAVNEKLDVQVVIGNGASPKFLKSVNIGSADLVVALTNSDEVNMLACMFAKQSGATHTVARVRNVEYAQDDILKANKSLGIDLFINPEQVTANAITNYIEVPEAVSVSFFDKRKVLMIELRVPDGSPIDGRALKDLRSEKPFLITAILRKNQMIIPNGNELIRTGDSLFIIALSKDMPEVERSLGFARKKVEQVMILGGGRLGYYLANNLEPTDIDVRVVEKKISRCERLSELLDTTIILQGDASDIDLLQEEGVHDMDILVSSTEDDKLNVLTCLLASRLGAKKTIAQIRRSDYLPLIESVGIDVSVSPRLLTCEAIMRFIQKGNLISMGIVRTGSAEVFEVYVEEKHKHLVDKAIKDIKFPKGAIVASILRDGKIIIPRGNDVILSGDYLNLFVARDVIRKVAKMVN